MPGARVCAHAGMLLLMYSLRRGRACTETWNAQQIRLNWYSWIEAESGMHCTAAVHLVSGGGLGGSGAQEAEWALTAAGLQLPVRNSSWFVVFAAVGFTGGECCQDQGER